MKNILIVYNRELTISLKKRKVIMLLIVFLIFFALFFTLLINYIIIGIKNNIEINFNRIKNFMRIGLIVSILFTSFMPILFFSTSINTDKKNKTIENILNTNITKKDIVIGKFLNGIISLFTLFFASLPIFYLTVILGGIGLFELLKIVLLLIFFMMFISSIDLFISSIFYELNTSIFVSIFVSIFSSIIMFLLINFLNNDLNFIITILFFLIFIVFFINLTIKSKLFKY